MVKTRWIAGAAVALSLAAISAPAVAQVDFELRFGPPEPRYEILPAERPGYVWAPGYWDWRNGDWVWVRGHWVRERPNMYYRSSRWEERDGRWVFRRGGWYREPERYAYYDPPRAYRDRDDDGIPNRYDRDRDGDGVPNWRDDFPNNPRRW